MSTEFLDSLRPVDDTTRGGADVCDDYLTQVKGIALNERTLLGYRNDADVGFYYYKLADGILEFAVTEDRSGRITRRVTDFITDPTDIQDMLGAKNVIATPDSTQVIFQGG